MARFIALVSFLIGLLGVFSAAYLSVMFDWQIDSAAVIESLNYSTQTITSVGYGNWVPTWWEPCDQTNPAASCQPDFHSRILEMKRYSIMFTLLGAGYFAVVIGAFVNWCFPKVTA